VQSDVRTPNHAQREVAAFKGLNVALEDTRLVQDGFLSEAHNVVFDPMGNVRARDGSEQWWAPISQRVYLAEMEPVEDGTWTGGAVSQAVVDKGYQARSCTAAGAQTLARVPAAPIDCLLAGGYTETQASLTLSFRAATPADVASCVVYLSSGADFTALTRTWDITANVVAATAGTWTTVTKTVASGTNVVSAPNFAAITRMQIAVTLTSGTLIYFDEFFVSFSEFGKSFCTGGIEYRRISDSKRYTVAGFGETIFADLNESKVPYKILSQVTRNAPLNFEIAEDRLAIFNGLDANQLFTGSTVRALGYPAPTGWTTPVAGVTTGGSMTSSASYYYGVTFIYGLGAAKHGQSTMFESTAAATMGASDTKVNLQNIPVGGLGSGVVARRIYRCRANAGPDATKYFVAEVADNTTTTYADVMADTELVLNDDGPLNNGIPPVSKMGVWFEKGMVYLTKSAVQWSRPGTNLDESFEIVPAENILFPGTGGELTGAVEFNGSLYVFSRNSIGKLGWRGSSLEYAPVQRTNDSRSQNIGAADFRAISIVQDRYIRFMDTAGQVWRMLPNEEFYPDSEYVAPILNDFNYLPLSSSLDYYRVDSEAQWNTGTLGTGTNDNLSTGDVSGRLQYSPTAISPDLGGASSGGTSFTSPEPPIGRSLSNGALALRDMQQVIIAEGKAVSIANIRFRGVCPTATTWTMTVYKLDTSAGVLGLGAVLTTLNGSGQTGTYPVTYVGGSLSSSIWLPKGEGIIVRIAFSDVYGVSLGLLTYSGSAVATNYVLGGFNYIGYAETPWNGDAFSMVLGGTELVKDVYTYAAPVDGTTALQRWHQLASATNILLRSAQSVLVEMRFSTASGSGYYTDVTGTAQWFPVYRKDFVSETGAAEPLSTVTTYMPPIADYRVGSTYPTNTQWRYAEVRVTFDHTRSMANPCPVGQSRSSLNYVDAFGHATAISLAVSKETSFASYNKNNYTWDHWTSETVATSGIASFGKFAANYTENQQDIFFQVRSATSAGAIGAATWVDFTPNSVLGSTGVVAGATHFQIRIIFQDNAGKSNIVNSFVDDLTVSWAPAGAENASLIPPAIFHYKEYTFMSWPSLGSRITDKSAAVSDYKEQYAADAKGMWSTFGAPHYACYFVVGGKLIGGQSAGGRLNRLRNSAVTDAGTLQYQCRVLTVPMNLGSMKIKTLHHLYWGLVLNVHKDGRFLRDPGLYPTATPEPAFVWGVIGQNGGYIVQAQSVYRFVFPHAAEKGLTDALATGPYFRPYQVEYGTEVGVQERAYQFRLVTAPFLDTSGNAIFPTLTNIGMEYFIENYRGV
jgi:hypothetical protein